MTAYTDTTGRVWHGCASAADVEAYVAQERRDQLGASIRARREALGVSLHQVRLELSLQRRPLHALGSVWVEVELLGVASKKSKLLSAPVHRVAEQGVLATVLEAQEPG